MATEAIESCVLGSSLCVCACVCVGETSTAVAPHFVRESWPKRRMAQVSPRSRRRKLVASSIQATAWARRGHLAPAIAAIVLAAVRSRSLYPFLEEVWPAALGGPGTACCYWILSGCQAWATSGKNCVLLVFDDSCDIQSNRCTIRSFASSILIGERSARLLCSGAPAEQAPLCVSSEAALPSAPAVAMAAVDCGQEPNVYDQRKEP